MKTVSLIRRDLCDHLKPLLDHKQTCKRINRNKNHIWYLPTSVCSPCTDRYIYTFQNKIDGFRCTQHHHTRALCELLYFTRHDRVSSTRRPTIPYAQCVAFKFIITVAQLRKMIVRFISSTKLIIKFLKCTTWSRCNRYDSAVHYSMHSWVRYNE